MARSDRHVQRQPSDRDCTDVSLDTITSNEFAKPLRFPPFHTEILQQSHWDAGEDLGRIRVVIAEGLVYRSELPSVHAFDKLREIAVFSFQHAPKHILEYSGIAWPNDRMFVSSHANCRGSNYDAHAHSPRRPSSTTRQRETVQAQMPTNTPESIALYTRRWVPPSIKPTNVGEDPFVGPSQTFRASLQRRTNVDVSMHDLSTSNRSLSEMSGVETEQHGLEQPIHKAGADEILRVLIPPEGQSSSNALPPPKRETTESGGNDVARPLLRNRTHLMRILDPNSRSQSTLERVIGRSPDESQPSISGQSGKMSWEDAPTLSDLWSGNSNEYPGLLPSIQSSSSKRRSTSQGSKRKRSPSPPILHLTDNEIVPNTEGISTPVKVNAAIECISPVTIRDRL